MESEILKYNYLLQLDKLKNYSCTIENNEDKTLATSIYDNFDKLDDLGRRNLLTKCLSNNEINMHLLKFELINKQNDDPENELTLDEFEKQAFKIINRYHWKAGGFKIEDSEWIQHKHNSKLYDVLSNELLFENTLDRSDVDDEETERYMDHLTRHLNYLSKNIEVEYRYKNTKEKIVRVLIWATDKNIESVSDSESNEGVGL